jgi:hypothetical protein
MIGDLSRFGLENRRKSSPIFNYDIYLLFYLLFILCLKLTETSFGLIKYTVECTIQTNRTIQRADNERHERNTEVENNDYVVLSTDQLGNRMGVRGGGVALLSPPTPLCKAVC